MEKYKDILDKAYEAMDNAYAPYSNFHVGACVKTKDGKYFIGANIENASYGLTNCAERNAIFQTYSQGYRQDDIEALAIVGQGNTLITPCGACRQVLVELLKRDTPIVLGTGEKVLVTNIEELMPMAFTNEAL
ncbi:MULTISPECIES: cytidine deaminase [Fusobacterium]|jgi:cytidine deaminase|uniref:cytidine deaminase n=1 Tax=Fusobacterium TaxID=848 RepID=UPI001EEEB9E1|nr:MULTISPECIES: cytidine deaminase [Fusobacterium]MCF2611996.1 cytidine deaminase [Fusobacterium perfoetens]MDY2980011.1 cytidine deaminase [Fusobacterium sp.]